MENIVRKGFLYMFIYLLLVSLAEGNNLQISNVSTSGQNSVSDYVMIEFDCSWDNSWRTDNLNGDGVVNWDAIWLFVKYQKASDGIWYHATLNSIGINHSKGSQGASATLDTRNDGKGVFYYRSGNGVGTFSSTNIRLRWEYGIDGIGDDLDSEVTLIKVFGIEMVYVPEGSFFVGDGSIATFPKFHQGNNTSNSFQITSEVALRLGNDNGASLWSETAWDNPVNGTMLSANYPKGYAAFYCMKYEITQEQYVDFLNTLSRTQQNNRIGTDISGTNIIQRYVMTNSSNIVTRNGIRCDATIPAGPTPITFYCDFNGNGIANESGDGKNIACNFLSWADGVAYSDWACLRPMTELEFEKACRGPKASVAGEYAWGSTAIQSATGISNSGTSSESPSNGTANCIYNGGVGGPMRVGSCTSGSRSSMGATYYGIMDMSGNIRERIVTVGNMTGRSYTGAMGDGILDVNGNANVNNWPGINSIGSGLRGGVWNGPDTFSRVSHREHATFVSTSRDSDRGFRCVSNIP